MLAKNRFGWIIWRCLNDGSPVVVYVCSFVVITQRDTLISCEQIANNC